jgi:hypothetical protein
MLRFTAAPDRKGRTGTSIWFTTWPSRPADRCRIFCWAWFTEWIVFFLEVVGLLVL